MVNTELRHGGGHLRLVIDEPKANLVSIAVMRELRRALAGVHGMPALKLVTIEGAGDHFSFGASVEEHRPGVIHTALTELHGLIGELLATPAPTAAIVRGRCLGGGFEIAQAVDLVVAGDDATFGQPEILLGVIPPAACALLPFLAGPARAAEAVFTGDPLNAAQALAAGLVARVVPAGRVDEEALALAGRIARHSAAALRVAKRALRPPARERAEAEALAVAGRRYARELMHTADAAEGLTAFLEKRAPAWAPQ